MKIVEKAVAAVVRTVGEQRELLVFRHPDAQVQLPRGTIEPRESIPAAALRELEEESGLKLACAPIHIGTWERVVDDKADAELHPWHLCLLDAPAGLPETWDHCATGSPDEEGLIFAFRWIAMDADLPARLDPLFGPVSRLLLDHFGL